MSHTDYKQKHAQANHRERMYNMNTMVMSHAKPNETIRENFYRPAYGKIGERRKSFYEDNI